MLSIESIDNKDILEMVTYRHTNQPNPNYSKIQILRGYNFYARCVEGRLQEWTTDDTTHNATRRYKEAVQFEVKLGSEKV